MFFFAKFEVRSEYTLASSVVHRGVLQEGSQGLNWTGLNWSTSGSGGQQWDERKTATAGGGGGGGGAAAGQRAPPGLGARTRAPC